MAFLFAKQQGLEVAFLMQVYVIGWGSGWRDYELEGNRSTARELTGGRRPIAAVLQPSWRQAGPAKWN